MEKPFFSTALRALLILFALTAGSRLMAQTFEQGGIRYEATAGRKAYVRKCVKSPRAALVIPSSVTYKGKRHTVTGICDKAFQNCRGITSVVVPGSVREIEEKAFQNCSSLRAVTIRAGVRHIGDKAFQNCTRLASVSIAPGLRGIGDKAFQNCSSLRRLTIPASVRGIGDKAFQGCRLRELRNLSRCPVIWDN